MQVRVTVRMRVMLRVMLMLVHNRARCGHCGGEGRTTARLCLEVVLCYSRQDYSHVAFGD